MNKILPLIAVAMLGGTTFITAPAEAQLSIGISVNFAPPVLPVYDQPPIPAPDYIWIPGYWAWDNDVQDYFWIPGTWMLAPRPGLLWTPAWWGWQDGVYMFHEGYWGPHVGFYGGVHYGFGYGGSGYEGAYWRGGHVFYNRSVTNITNVRITNVYNKTVVVNRVTNVSYNGGPGGIQARPSSFEQAAMREPHLAPTPVQQQHVAAARGSRQLFASANHGRPAIAATARPALFNGPGVVPARQAPPYHPPGHGPAATQGQPGQDRPDNRGASRPAASPDDRQRPAQPPRRPDLIDQDDRPSPAVRVERGGAMDQPPPHQAAPPRQEARHPDVHGHNPPAPHPHAPQPPHPPREAHPRPPEHHEEPHR